MAKKMKLGIFFLAGLATLVLLSPHALAQQTLGGITGTISDKSGSVLPETTVTIVADQTKLTRIQQLVAMKPDQVREANLTAGEPV